METELRQRAAPAASCFTLSLDENHRGALTDHVDTLRLAFRACRDRYPFTLTAGVILPDHMHCILTVSPDDTARAARWRLIKGLFERVVDGGRSAWKPDVEERLLPDDAELSRQIDYIHSDPVRHGLARLPRNWPYSSFHAYVAHGFRPMYWCGDMGNDDALRFARRAA
ncbi:MAG: transposase [Pseudomonadota bacterium]|nr:transposase [Pseudomonadota bacterium]